MLKTFFHGIASICLFVVFASPPLSAQQKADLGGALGLLDFGRDRMATLINTGFNDAVENDCAKTQCVPPS
jgi:hypothetical protein